MKKLRAALGKLAAEIIPGLIGDGALLGGAGLVAYGAWLIYPPAGIIVAGILLMTAAVINARS